LGAWGAGGARARGARARASGRLRPAASSAAAVAGIAWRFFLYFIFLNAAAGRSAAPALPRASAWMGPVGGAAARGWSTSSRGGAAARGWSGCPHAAGRRRPRPAARARTRRVRPPHRSVNPPALDGSWRTGSRRPLPRATGPSPRGRFWGKKPPAARPVLVDGQRRRQRPARPAASGARPHAHAFVRGTDQWVRRAAWRARAPHPAQGAEQLWRSRLLPALGRTGFWSGDTARTSAFVFIRNRMVSAH